MNQPPGPAHPPPAVHPGCWWHPNRPTGLSCTRCGRPACPDCLREAPVGYQCLDCVHTQPAPDVRPGVRKPPSPVVTYVLIAVNVAVFLLTVLTSGSLLNNDASALFQRGDLWPIATLGANEWWRVITSGFLHYGPLHIAANMFSLWMIGRALEQIFGKARYLALYFVAMFGGAVAVLLFQNPAGGSAGASGALFGLLGCYAVLVVKLKLNPTNLIVNLVVNAAITFGVPGISIYDHAGGLVTGALVTVALLYAPKVNRARWQAIGITIVALALVGLTAYRGAQIADYTCRFGPYQGTQAYVCAPA